MLTIVTLLLFLCAAITVFFCFFGQRFLMNFLQFLPYLSLLRYVLQQLIVFAVAMVAVVNSDCQFFAAVDIVVIAAAVVAVYSSPLLLWGGW
jgi:hypothetical protein